MSRSSTILLAVVLLLLVWAVLATMALNKAKESNNTERAAYVDSVNALVTDKDELIRILYDSLASQDTVIEALKGRRLNPQVFIEEAAQQLEGQSLDSLVNELEKSVQ